MANHSVPVYENISEEEIRNKINERKPFVIRNYDIGPCSQLWTHEYLSKKVGNAPIKIHVSSDGRMDFVKKNFLYKTLPFDELILRASRHDQTDYFIHPKEFYYLRSLGSDPRGREVANFIEQYPEVAKDLKIPNFFNKDDLFSSVFRVGSPGVRLWTHYDIMDNILIQVHGAKEVILWPPSEIENMYLIGDKSEVLDVENPDLEKFPKFAKAVSYKGVLQSGDIIFIPALWFHNTLSIEPSIAINLFWKNLPHEFYDKKDPYGNKDLVAGAKVCIGFVLVQN